MRPPAVVALVLLGLAGSAWAAFAAWIETFSQGRLDPARWETVAEGDFRERTVDVVEAGKRWSGDFRLRLRADTRGTRDDTVKFLGVRSVRSFGLRRGARVSVTLDWNEQANGSYLSAGLVLSPQATATNPLRGPSWLTVEYVGVPPGRNARMVVALRDGGRERILYGEGWPDSNRAGRRIGRQQVTVVIRERSLQVWENQRLVHDAGAEPLPFDAAFLYILLSSHSNYPAREVYVDDVQVEGDDP